MEKIHIEFAQDALDGFPKERRAADEVIVQRREVTTGPSVKPVEAPGDRELAAAVITAVTVLGDRAKRLDARIQAFTTRADQGTDRLARWTMGLAVATTLLILTTVAQTVVIVLARLK